MADPDPWAQSRRIFIATIMEMLPPSDHLATLAVATAEDEWLYEIAAAYLNDADAGETDVRSGGVRLRRLRELIDGDADRDTADAREIRRVLLSSVRHAGPDDAVIRIAVGVIADHLADLAGRRIPVPDVVTELGNLLDLDIAEQRILTVLHVTADVESGHRQLREISESEMFVLAAHLCGVSVAELARLTASGSRLTAYGLLGSGRGDRDEFLDMALSRPLTFSFRAGSLNELSAGMFEEQRAARYEVDSFPLSPVDVEAVEAVLRSNRSVLLSGEPGVGKTEFARSIAARVGRIVREISPRRGAYASGVRGQSTTERLLLARLAAAYVDRKREILLVDEADAVLQGASGFLLPFGLGGGSFDKAELNALLEDIDVATIWICNETGGIPTSALRRFGHIVQFPRPNAAMRARMIEQALETAKIELAPGHAAQLSRSYDLTPAAIDRVVRIVAAAPDAADSTATGSRIEAYLKETSRGPVFREFRRLPAPQRSFQPRFCTTSTPLERIESYVRSRAQQQSGARLLFDGPPGGGKTQYALYLAALIDREAALKRPSDILSPWVGVAEQNIARAFRDAERSGAVLILDEADALLASRAGAQRNWEVAQAAEFLQQLNEYEGMVIACTNRIESVDPALRRRFHRRVTFGPLSPDLLVAALAHLFPGAAFGDTELALLRHGPPLMMSDLGTAAEMLAEERPSANEIVEEILANAQSRDMTTAIGF